MEVILQQDVDNLGHVGEIVRVKPGYARNYLIPRGLAVLADRRNLRVLEHQKRVVQVKVDQARKAAEEEAKTLSKLRIEVMARAGSEGRLFGSVTNQDIQAELARQGVTVDRRKIHLERPIKSLGEHEVEVTLTAGVRTRLTVSLVPDPTSVVAEEKDVAEEEAPAPSEAEPPAAEET